MEKLILFTETDKNKLLNKRPGESKFGEHIQLITDSINIYEQLLNLDVDYVLFGISEDVGVFANYGITGTSTAWDCAIKFLLNAQKNDFTSPERLLVLGHIDFNAELNAIAHLNQKKESHIKKARKLVSEIDKIVTQIVHDIVKAGKKPIIIGGGHNNAYGNIKGTSLALKTSVNAVNIDAHTDFRAAEGRHSGNGFSYAYSEGFLNKYFIFGIHENYIPQSILEDINKQSRIAYNTFESIYVRKELKFKAEYERALEFVSEKPFGIEIDCDAIVDMPSSQLTPSGFSANKVREFLNYFGKHNNATYLHICEAAPKKKTQQKIGKFISYLVTDFMRANEN